MTIQKCKHQWTLRDDGKMFCKVCQVPDFFDGENIKTLSMGVGVQTCYLLLKYWYDYDVIIHSDIANGDREHGEYDITYWILDNIVKPFCEEKNLPLWILEHEKMEVFC